MDPVTICNMALHSLGQKAIASIDDDKIDTDEAQLCATFYDPSVREMLEEGAPLFATGLFNLGARQDSDYKILGGDHTLIAKFAFDSSNLVRPLDCDDGTGDFTIRWERSGDFILCEDTVNLYCRAVQLILDPNKWNPAYYFAAAYKLAALIAGPITHSAAIEQKMVEKYAGQMKKAANLDGMQGSTNQQVKINSTSLMRRR